MDHRTRMATSSSVPKKKRKKTYSYSYSLCFLSSLGVVMLIVLELHLPGKMVRFAFGTRGYVSDQKKKTSVHVFLLRPMCTDSKRTYDVGYLLTLVRRKSHHQWLARSNAQSLRSRYCIYTQNTNVIRMKILPRECFCFGI